jgi:Zn-finger nucleic acid-binding protein
MAKYPCPECGRTISDKNYDSAFEMYECPKCEGMFTFDELLEGGGNALSEATEASQTAVPPKAKGKLRQEQMERDAEADAKQIEEITKNVKKGVKEEKHRDEIKTGSVLNIMADEIESICDEAGIQMDRLNAREFFAMNLYRPLMLAGFKAREQEVKFVGCVDHS